MVRIDEHLVVPESELTFTAARSSGPGGQHVNTSSTRVTLLFDVLASPSLTDEQRASILKHLKNRINREGVLRVTAQDSRSQAANRRAAVNRFAELLRGAVATSPSRRHTRIPKSADRRRLEDKRRQSERKKRRRWRPKADDF